MHRTLGLAIVHLALLAGCISAPASPSPSTSLATTAPSSGGPSGTVPLPSPVQGSEAPVATGDPAPSRSRPPSSTLPIHGHARVIGERILLAPGPNGALYTLIPKPGGALLALLDSGGRPRPGWPIEVGDSTDCGLLLPVADGSVRVVCTMENPDGNMFAPVRAFSFDAAGSARDGWPVAIGTDVF